MNPEPEHWRQFQGSELGSLLSGLYGGKNSRPVISYPKPKQRKAGAPRGKWLPVNNEVTSTDPRKTTRRDKKVNVPSVGRKQYGDISLIDCVPRRKNEIVIAGEMDELRMQNSHYRPAHFQVRGDAEKERLSQVFGYKGGVCLPEEMTNIPSQAPYEIAEKRRKMEAMAAKRKNFPQFRNALDGHPSAGPGMRTKVSQLTHDENMANQISTEIDERVEYLNEMKEAGALDKSEQARLQQEIAARIQELKGYDEGA